MSAAVAMVAVMALSGCSSGEDRTDEPDTTTSTTTASSTSGSTEDQPASDGAAVAADAEAATAGEPIVDDGAIEIPGLDGGTAVYELRQVRLTAPTDAVDCPGGSPVNAQRLVVDLTAYLVPSQDKDPNVVIDDAPLPIPYVSQLPEVVLVGVGEDSVPDAKWFVGISPVSRLLVSAPNTYLRPAPAGDATGCAIEGWEPTDLAEAVGATEMTSLSSGFVPADFDPADYQIRIGRGDDFAYCWPMDDLTAPAELGRCR